MRYLIFVITFVVLVVLNSCGGGSGKSVESRPMINTQESPIPIVIIGPSTVQGNFGADRDHHKDGSLCPIIVGWGEVFADLAKKPSLVYNYARAGASAESFKMAPNGQGGKWDQLFGPKQDRYWAKTKEKMKELGEGILLIQFGGNDQHFLQAKYPHDLDSQKKEFIPSVKFYIDEARALNFTPILVTSPETKRFDSNGNIVTWRDPYPEWMKELARDEGIALIDLNKKSRVEFAKYGTQEALNEKFGECYAGDYQDTTHYFSKEDALIVARWIRDLACGDDGSSLLCSQLKY